MTGQRGQDVGCADVGPHVLPTGPETLAADPQREEAGGHICTEGKTESLTARESLYSPCSQGLVMSSALGVHKTDNPRSIIVKLYELDFHHYNQKSP